MKMRLQQQLGNLQVTTQFFSKSVKPLFSRVYIKVKRRRKAEDEYEPPGEDEYDLSDPFIDDSELDEEEEEESEEDDDYVPDNDKDADREFNNEEEWQEAAEDAPEVLQLLAEARDFLRDKKMQK